MSKRSKLLDVIAVINELGAVHKVRHAIFGQFHPSPCHTSSHISRPLRKYVTHLGPPISRRPSTKTRTKAPLYKFCVNCSRGFLSGGLVRGIFCPFPFCQNTCTSVTSES